MKVVNTTTFRRGIHFFLSIIVLFFLGFCTSNPRKIGNAKAYSISREKIDFNIEWNNEFIDSYALAAPYSVENDLDSLAFYLTYPFQTDRAKARAIFRWIASNIEYDWESLQSGAYIRNSMEAKDVLKSRSTVCEGYSNLFKELANRAGLESEKIIGYAKGYGYNPDQALGGVDHAWNAIKIGGEWKLVDVTWAGGGDRVANREKKFNDFYFLTPPEHFINDHLPSITKWQLLDRPISKAEFHKNVKKSPHYFKLGIHNLNFEKFIIRSDTIFSIQFETAKKLKFHVYLNKSDKHYFVSQYNDRYGIHIISPGKGTYSLELYGNETTENDGLQFLLEYKVIFNSGHKDNQFVTIYSGDHTIHDPMLKFLNAYQLYDFKFTVPGIRRIAFIDGNRKWTYYENQNSDYYFIRNYFPKGKLTINIDIGKDSWPTIAEYYVK